MVVVVSDGGWWVSGGGGEWWRVVVVSEMEGDGWLLHVRGSVCTPCAML